MTDLREKYRNLGIPVRADDGFGHVLPDGRIVKSSADNSVVDLSWGGEDKYAVDLGGCCAVGELWGGKVQCWPGDDYLSWLNGVVFERYDSIELIRARRRAMTMPDGEYELAIGEGIPAGSPLLQTKAARKARRKVGIEEVP